MASPIGFNPARHRMSIIKPFALGFGLRTPKNYPEDNEGSTTALQTQKGIPVRLENTYKLEPDNPFKAFKVRDVILDLLQERLLEEKYNFIDSARVAKELSSKIKDRVKKMGFKRYKIVVQVLITPKSEQGLQLSSRCAWDEKHDNFAAVTYSNSSLCAVALVYGSYFE